jgi:hypothetical protein
MRNYFSHEALTEPSLRNFIFAPIIGLAFLMFLPFIGFFLTIKALLMKAGQIWSNIHVVGSQPAIGTAYLTGTETSTKLPESNDCLADLEKEVLDRRNKKP